MADEKEVFMSLQHSESIVANMAATVYAGLVNNPRFKEASDELLVNRSVAIAILLAERAEKLVKSDEEWKRKESGSSYL
jgi:hypothetical protein